MPEPLPGPDPRLAWVWTEDAWRKARIVGDTADGPVVHTSDGATYGVVSRRFVREIPEGQGWPPEPTEPPEGVVVAKPGFLGE